jgi:maleate isomerase
MYGYRGKIGILVPSINTTMEMDFHKMAPEGISVHTARISWDAPESSVESLREMTDKAVKAAKDVAAAHVDVIVYGCTSGSFFKGISWDRELSELLTRETKIPTITTTTAGVEGLREMGIKKVSVGTPYSEEVDKRLEAFLQGNGFQVMKLESLRQRDVWEHARNAPYVLYELGKKAFVPGADGIFISCTQLRAVDIVEQLEKDVGRPVITAVQASMWLALKTLGFKSPVAGYGTLMTRLSN